MTNPMTHLDAYADEELQQVLDRILAQARGEVLGIRDTWKRFIAISEAGVLLCVWAWKPVGTQRWFERLLGELQFELRIGDAPQIRTKRVRKQKTDRQDAQLILRLFLEDRFPQIWVPSWENRDLRQLLWHRHRIVQARTRIRFLQRSPSFSATACRMLRQPWLHGRP